MDFGKDPQQLFTECAAQPSPNSFKILYDVTQARLFAVCLRILKDQQLAQDCLQTSYVKIWRNLGSYDSQKSKAITWMSRIVRNEALDMLKRKQIVDFVDDVPDMEDPSLQRETKLLAAEQSALLAHCLEQLKPQARHCILGNYFDGLTLQQVAEQQQQPLSTVKTWVRRSLPLLKICLERSYEQH
jgi:RNA polymerase sigma-70 factor (ECF subfamily)